MNVRSLLILTHKITKKSSHSSYTRGFSGLLDFGVSIVKTIDEIILLKVLVFNRQMSLWVK